MGAKLEPGAVIAGRYRLLRLLGQGGMGSVWAATHTVTRRDVAMKFVRGPGHARRELRQRILREARAASAVRHPNVVDVIDVFELDEDTPVMVMDLLTGETLGARIEREERLSLTETAKLLLPAVSAIGTAHARGIVHRDLKPDNVFLARDAETITVKVLDFGIAKLGGQDGLATETAGLITQAGSTLGTPCYMAPEQATGEKDLDHRVDIWALGTIVYECLSGVRPIDGETVGQVVMSLMSTGITPIERVVLDVPQDIADLVARMLSRERRLRPLDLREVAGVLSRYSDAVVPEFGAPGTDVDAGLRSEFLDHAAPRAGATELPADPGRSKTLKKPWIALAVATVALGLVAFAFSRSKAEGLQKAGPELPRPVASASSAPAAIALESAITPSPPAPSATATPVRKRPATPAATHRQEIEKKQTPSVQSPTPPKGLAETPPF